MDWPTRLQSNGWIGAQGAASSTVDHATKNWVYREKISKPMLWQVPEDPPDDRKWRDPRVGWGLVLPDNDAVPKANRARADDVPAPLQRLVAARQQAPVLRWRSDLPPGVLRRYGPDGTPDDLAIANRLFGTGPGAIPRYLLIYADPATIPWRAQYELQATHFVGRLSLTGAALDRYVSALEDEWVDAATDFTRTVLWSVRDGEGDITDLMRTAVAAPVHARLAADADFAARCRFIDGKTEPATVLKLLEALTPGRPSLIVTTSHGMTGPLNRPDQMAATLGTPVDQNGVLLSVDDLLGAAAPHGAIWYSHACCSAGSDARTAYNGLVSEGGSVDQLLKGVAGLGSTVAPMPQALLGGEKPIRAFVGHVEPTFDWSLKAPWAAKPMTNSIQDALYQRLFRREPLGMALDSFRQVSHSLAASYEQAREQYEDGNDSLHPQALACRLMACDWRSVVILGDPTVRLPA
jgi:hypothetical protein